jgi:hypothetical protein
VETLLIAALIALALICLAGLLLIEPHHPHQPPPQKPREGGAAAMPAQVRPSPGQAPARHRRT